MQDTGNTMNTKTSARGFAITDVLMAILLFSVGILGLVGLQGAMTKNQLEAKVRAEATYLANELIAQMWSDTANIANYTSSGCAGHTPCNTWKSKVTAALPSGAGSVATTSSGDVTVTITWTNTAGDTHRYETHTTIAAAGS